eukprot:TRINITY_DN9993_c0_g1_i1.p2 TRINITY_DN9993_c0_g1~~TRINITY_DN9993_c0_g1_i1.p2  ORF type:complete len:382 (+),score=163.66 TRINITY_DN9993_c0_g1_i1:37-1182(+)
MRALRKATAAGVRQRRWQSAASPAAAAADAPPAGSAGKGPFEYIRADLDAVAGHIEDLVRINDTKIVDNAARHLLRNKGKMLRPAIVALSGYAAMPADSECRRLHGGMSMTEIMAQGKKDLSNLDHPFNKHLRLAEVTELVHTASLIHDDVLDQSDTRRGQDAVHKVYGIKEAVLTGDFLLARASKWLSTLGDARVVEAMSQALEDLTVGEILQMEGGDNHETYMKKTFCKTASLIAHSCRGSAILSHPSNPAVHDAVFAYGKHVGIAFQIVDDVLDFTATPEELGKPAGADLKAGVVTLPVLLAAERNATLKTMIERKFCMDGDHEEAFDLVKSSGAVEEAQARAKAEIDAALKALEALPSTCARDSMANLTDMVLSRRK